MGLYQIAETVVDSTAWAPVMEAMTSQINITTVVGVLGTTMAAGIGLVFMWWGVRKAVRALWSAFSKGRTKV